MKFSLLTIALLLTLVSCDSQKYSDEEEKRMEEAIALHNEAMAIFSDTRPLLKDLTDARIELKRRTGLTLEDTISPQAITAEDAPPPAGGDTTAANSAAAESGADPMENIPATTDTTASEQVQQALRALNESQNELLLWMRSIYRVPGYKGIYEDEKTPESAETSTHKDYDANMLLTDMQFIEMPADAGVEEVYEKQKEMKEEILRIQVEITRAIENARTAYLNYN